MKRIKIKINAKTHELQVKDNELLLELLRDRLGLLGTKYSCLEGECGACTVLLDGRNILSCMFLAAEADGCEVVTVEGLADYAGNNFIQESFIEKGAIQCGFCTPGMLLATKSLLDRKPEPGDDEIKTGLDGNLCRCTGYVKIIDAVREASKRLKNEK